MAIAVHLGFKVETYAAGVVVDDRETMWTADASDFAAALAGIDVRRYRDERHAYGHLCSLVPPLSQADPERHAVVVDAWREAHGGAIGNWA